MPTSCPWPGDDPLYIRYHDTEWGVPVRDDRELLEHLILDGQQAGLSWITILRKRESYREAYDGFDPERVAKFTQRRVERLLANPGIIRNRLKVRSPINNCRVWLAMQESGEPFGLFLWSFVGGQPKVNRFRSMKQVPAETDQSRAMSKALKQRGFSFVGPTICYAFMQAVGMVNDHLVGCPRHREIQELA
jgi:DNA-3-methyladenine glycosylase I